MSPRHLRIAAHVELISLTILPVARVKTVIQSPRPLEHRRALRLYPADPTGGRRPGDLRLNAAALPSTRCQHRLLGASIDYR